LYVQFYDRVLLLFSFFYAGEAFVAKYECAPGKQAGLGRHRDGTPWSFVMALNSPDVEFRGGGTKFFPSEQSREDEGLVYRPKAAGDVLVFSGRHFHEGDE
jgi:hypothetical protein